MTDGDRVNAREKVEVYDKKIQQTKREERYGRKRKGYERL